jgi:small subunit ribosomal protein S9
VPSILTPRKTHKSPDLFQMSLETTILTTGRRKSSVASIRLNSGSGAIKINGRDFTDYFGSISLQNQILRPLEIANSVHTYDVIVKATGGGINGQAGALRLALSRALVEIDDTLRLAFKAEGLLTRDPRMKERKKPGQPGARKRFQFSKR